MERDELPARAVVGASYRDNTNRHHGSDEALGTQDNSEDAERDEKDDEREDVDDEDAGVVSPEEFKKNILDSIARQKAITCIPPRFTAPSLS